MGDSWKDELSGVSIPFPVFSTEPCLCYYQRVVARLVWGSVHSPLPHCCPKCDQSKYTCEKLDVYSFGASLRWQLLLGFDIWYMIFFFFFFCFKILCSPRWFLIFPPFISKTSSKCIIYELKSTINSVFMQLTWCSYIWMETARRNTFGTDTLLCFCLPVSCFAFSV